MLSKDDIKKLIEVFATKAELKAEIRRVREEMVTKSEFGKAINKLDAVLGELKDFRQEQTVHTAQHEEIHEDVGDLKRRVKTLGQLLKSLSLKI